MSGVQEISLETIERTNRESLNKLARDVAEWSQNLTIPNEGLELFLKSIPGPRMLDVGCGWASYVERFLGHDLLYTGIDLSEEMLAASKKKISHLRLAQMSFRNLSFRDACFEGIWCSCVLYHEPKRNMPAVLSELKRVLVPGGVLAIVMPYTGWSEENMQENGDGIKLYMASYELDEFVEMILDAGFKLEEAILWPEYGSMDILART